MLINRHTKESGFTLIELMAVVVLFGVVALIAIPNVKDIMKNSTTRSVARELYGQFQRAKIEAVNRSQNVAIVFTTSGTHQYQMFIDTDADGVLDGTEQVLSTTVMPDQHSLSNVTFTGSSAGFNSRGRPYWPSPLTWPTPDPKVEVVNTSTARKFTLTASLAGSVHLD